MRADMTVKACKKLHAETAGDIVNSRSVLTFHSKEKVSYILERMHDAGVAAAGVTDGSGRFMGLITEREIVRRVFNRSLDEKYQYDLELAKAAKDLTAWDVMIVNPMTIETWASIDDALDVITMHGFRYMPVMETKDKLAGIVDARELYEHSRIKAKKLLNEKDRFLSYFMGSEPYGYGGLPNTA